MKIGIILHLHISIPFRMGQQRPVPIGKHIPENIQQIARGNVGGSLDQYKIIPHSKEILLIEPFLKLRIQHIFRGQMELYRSFIGSP